MSVFKKLGVLLYPSFSWWSAPRKW